MKIVGSEVRMGGVNNYREKFTRQKRVQIHNGTPDNSTPRTVEDSLNLSSPLRRDVAVGVNVKTQAKTKVWEISDSDKQKILILMELLKALTGKEFNIKLLAPLQDTAQTSISLEVEEFSPPVRGWGMSIDISEIYHEQEEMFFAAEGILSTADGREIDFKVELEVSREYRQESNLRIQIGDAPMADPLVINYADSDAGIDGSTFKFDLYGTGSELDLPYLAPGSGYLVLDRNENGKTDDGLELFGPATGDGFAELKALDEDNNGWLDAGDSAFDKLKIWIKTAGGKEQLLTLRQAGIGALYVEGLDIAFSYKDGQNQKVAANRATGIFIREDGSGGTIQQIDIKV